MRKLFMAVCLLAIPMCVSGHEPVPFPAPSATVYCQQTPMPILAKHKNWDGSCVFLSMAVGGNQSNDPKCEYLPFDTIYGKAQRGGADPERVARVCAQRGIHVYNVTGKPTIPMARYAVATGRGCAIGFDYEHFQLVWGYDYTRKVWLIWDNRYPEVLTEYTEAEFEAYHDRCGRWVVVNEKPGDRIPKPRVW